MRTKSDAKNARRTAAEPISSVKPSTPPLDSSKPILEPVAQRFIDSLAGSPPLSTLSPDAAHKVLTDLQAKPVAMRPADIEDTTWPVGPTGTTKIRIVRPAGARETLPLLFYTHGGGWVLGDTITSDWFASSRRA
jgi:acetyl esterase